MRRYRVLGLIAATSLLLAMGLGAGPTASATPSNGAVKIFRLAYYPNTLDVVAGASVRFNNIDGKNEVPHSATSVDGLFDTGVFFGSSRTITAPSVAGTYEYTCVVHPFMHGFLLVSAAPAPPPEPVPGEPEFTG
jgi:plastocyanin